VISNAHAHNRGIRRSGCVSDAGRHRYRQDLKPIPVGGNPDAIAITPDGKTAYAVNQATSTVTPIRTATNKALKPIHIPGAGGYTGVIAISPNGKTALQTR
jgi:DNA-binding beta-propeller fold protein YncE